MPEVLTAAQMRATEHQAISSGGVTGLELMEHAGRGVFQKIFATWPELKDRPNRALVLCGPGNNGGDGFVIARLLHEAGWSLDLGLLGQAENLPPDAAINHDRWAALGETQDILVDLADNILQTGGVVIDALFGTGLTRLIGAELAELFEVLNTRRQGLKRVAVDVPSGLCADSGRILGSSLRADLTVTFHTAKPGHYLAEGPQTCGALGVVDIGLPKRGRLPSHLGSLTALQSRPKAAVLEKHVGHKYGYGHALVLSGGAGHTGAARLAARSALRVGAGLVTMGVPPSAQQEVASQITSIMLQRVTDAPSLTDILTDTRLNALCLGPGLGKSRAFDLVPVVLNSDRYVVLDADALSAFSGDPDALFDMLHEGAVLTPHGGEFAHLFPDIAERLHEIPTLGPVYSRVDATRDAAARAGCCVLLKGPDTVVAAADGRCVIHAASYERSAPWLATAGAGDVLAGLICGLMARGFDPFEAASIGAWLHVSCARSFGPGLIAEDLPEELPTVLRELRS